MTIIQQKRRKEIQMLVDAIRFNTGKTKNIKVICDADAQLNTYHERLPQLTLPKRFCMPKTQMKNVPTKNDVELETPESQPDSTYTTPEGHKRRDIFAS